LKHRYDKDYGIQNFDGSSYLDKLVQLPFYIPSHSKRVESFLSALIKQIPELTTEEREEFNNLKPIIGMISSDNPRKIIRFLNNLLIDRAINDDLVRSGMPRIPIVFFAVTRCFQQRWNDAYLLINNNGQICKRIIEWKNTPSSKEEDAGKSGPIKIILDYFEKNPALEMLLNTDIGQNWLKDGKTRLATENFLSSIRREENIKNIDQKKILLVSTFSDKYINSIVDGILINYLNIELFKADYSDLSNLRLGSFESINKEQLGGLIFEFDAIILILEKNNSQNISEDLLFSLFKTLGRRIIVISQYDIDYPWIKNIEIMGLITIPEFNNRETAYLEKEEYSLKVGLILKDYIFSRLDNLGIRYK
jgi:hypothetical protein